MLTVGQGVGAGIVLDGMLVRGTRHAAGEIGHVTALDERDAYDDAPLGRPQRCACGRTGCLETVLAVPALRDRAAGDPEALAAVGRRLGIVLAPVVSALNLAEVVLSGPPELLDGPLRLAAQVDVAEPDHARHQRRPAAEDDGARRGRGVARRSRARPVRSARGHMTPSRPNQRVGVRDPMAVPPAPSPTRKEPT